MPSAAILKPTLLEPAITAAALHDRLSASASATAVLQAVFGGPVVIRRVAGAQTPVPAGHCDLLGVPALSLVTHRRVILLAAGRPVSEADLWYVPSRLWRGMADTLRSTDTPFGAVVAPMQPRRQTLSACFGGDYALQHTALLSDSGGAAIALVQERYFHSAAAGPG